jgi:hypothetical protein
MWDITNMFSRRRRNIENLMVRPESLGVSEDQFRHQILIGCGVFVITILMILLALVAIDIKARRYN